MSSYRRLQGLTFEATELPLISTKHGYGGAPLPFLLPLPLLPLPRPDCIFANEFLVMSWG